MSSWKPLWNQFLWEPGRTGCLPSLKYLHTTLCSLPLPCTKSRSNSAFRPCEKAYLLEKPVWDAGNRQTFAQPMGTEHICVVNNVAFYKCDFRGVLFTQIVMTVSQDSLNWASPLRERHGRRYTLSYAVSRLWKKTKIVLNHKGYKNAILGNLTVISWM